MGLLEGHFNYVTSLSFNGNSTLLASQSEDLTAKIWDVEKKEEVDSFDNEEPKSLQK